MTDLTALFKFAPRTTLTGDLLELTDADDDAADLDAAGLSLAARERIWQQITRWYATGRQPFISVCIRRRGHKVLHRSIGHSQGDWAPRGIIDNSSAQVGSLNTPVVLYSASKAVTSILMHALAEDGLIDLDQRVSHYLPKFARHGKRRITLSDVLSHQSGISEMPDHLPIETIFDRHAVLEALYDTKPSGKHTDAHIAYHAVSGGYVLAAVAEQVTGKDLNALLRQRITGPLKMTSLTYGARPATIRNVARNYSTGGALPYPIAGFVRSALGADWQTVVDISNRREFFNTIIPAGNAIGTSDDLCRFMELLRVGGTLESSRVLAPETIARAIAPRTSTLFDRTLKIPMRYSEGLMLGANPVGMYGPLTARAYGHLGFINIFCWADPQRELSVALLSTGKSLLGLHLANLLGVLWSINSPCGRR